MRPQAKKKLQLVFEQLDSCRDNSIGLDEIKDYCQKLQVPIDEDDIKAFQENDKSGDGVLSFDEFCDFFQARLRKVFDAIDADGNQKLNAMEVHQVLQRMNIDIPLRKVESMLVTMDTDGSGQVDFDEFCDFFSDVPTPNMLAITSKLSGGLSIDIGSDIAPAPLPPPEMPLWQFIFAGGMGGVASRTATAPLETIKILAQTQLAQNKYNIFAIAGRVWNREGFKGFFAGNLTNVIRIFPTSAMVCLVYSRMIKYTPVDNEANPHQPLWRLLSGATAGVVATTFTHPLDVVRARLTVQSRSVPTSSQYKGILNALTRIKSEEGIVGLYRGLAPTLLSIAPFLAVQQCTYDMLKLSAVGKDKQQSVYTFLACGALAGAIAQTTVHPLDVVRRQMQVGREPSESNGLPNASWQALRTLWHKGGLPRLYAGLTAAYLKVIPSAMISLLVRDAILGRIKD